MKWILFILLCVPPLYASDTPDEHLYKKVEENIRELARRGVEPVDFLKEFISEAEITEAEKKRLLANLIEKIDYYGADRAASAFVREMNELLLSELLLFYSASGIRESIEAFRSGGFMRQLRFLSAYLDPFRFAETRTGRILPSSDGFIIITPDGMEELLRLSGRPVSEGRIGDVKGKLATVYGVSLSGGFVPLRIFEK